VLKALKRGEAAKDLVIIGVNVSDSPESARRYLDAVKPSWVVVEDADEEQSRAYQVEGLPTLVAIDAKGRIAAVRRGFVPQRELDALLPTLAAR
jgi:thioredoxin-related protein